nr:unnamed protein product [Callosobruchus chinensis]
MQILHFQTTIKSRLRYHMSKHPETGNCKLKVCKHCNATFISRFSLDDHIVRKHPTSVEDVSSKIYECKYCTFKTIHKSSFSRHVFNHSETSSCSKLKICKYCEATFKTDFARDDHVVRKHPDFIENVSRKIHECKHCTFKTTDKSGLTRHTMFKHPESTDSRERIQCVHCTATFYTKQSFHEHTIQKHPDFAESVPSKIHRCAYCPYKTIRKLKIDTHMLEHPQAPNVCHFSVCMHCSRKFKKEETLRAHILKKHTIFIASD